MKIGFGGMVSMKVDLHFVKSLVVQKCNLLFK